MFVLNDAEAGWAQNSCVQVALLWLVDLASLYLPTENTVCLQVCKSKKPQEIIVGFVRHTNILFGQSFGLF
jgi:hypothetical protein